MVYDKIYFVKMCVLQQAVTHQYSITDYEQKLNVLILRKCTQTVQCFSYIWMLLNSAATLGVHSFGYSQETIS